ncbi:MAG TPA: DUF1629 domain-containing protein [Candidatus Binatia bacterium]|nr:DUF1629 domain-containing protein [Candidatus Binatia bacterium]
MDTFERVEERPHPEGARTVADLVAAAQGSERITYRRTAEPQNPSRYYSAKQMGDYVYVPDFLNRPDTLDQPRPKRKTFHHKSVDSIGPIRIQFRDYGNRRLAPFYSGWSSSMYLVSDALLNVLRRFDPDGFESALPRLSDADGEEMHGYTVVMPTRVIDAVDIMRTTVVVERHTRAPEIGPSYTLVRYESGPDFRDDVVAPTFVEEYRPGWYWRLEIVRAVVHAGIRGLYFAHPYKRGAANEIRLPAEGDVRHPNDW